VESSPPGPPSPGLKGPAYGFCNAFLEVASQFRTNLNSPFRPPSVHVPERTRW
jgi:hypothetical protein